MIVELKLIGIHQKDEEMARDLGGRINKDMMKEQIYLLFKHSKFHANVYSNKIVIRYK